MILNFPDEISSFSLSYIKFFAALPNEFYLMCMKLLLIIVELYIQG